MGTLGGAGNGQESGSRYRVRMLRRSPRPSAVIGSQNSRQCQGVTANVFAGSRLIKSDLARSIAERDAQQNSWHRLDGAGALRSDEVIQAAIRLRSAQAARALVRTHTPER
jgi:hypothetical protein